MSLALLAFPGNNHASPGWYELKVRASVDCLQKEPHFGPYTVRQFISPCKTKAGANQPGLFGCGCGCGGRREEREEGKSYFEFT